MQTKSDFGLRHLRMSRLSAGMFACQLARNAGDEIHNVWCQIPMGAEVDLLTLITLQVCRRG